MVVAVRPERISLSACGPGLSGEIADVIYIGNARKYVVRLAGDHECIALRHVDPAAAPVSAPVVPAGLEIVEQVPIALDSKLTTQC